MSVNSAALRILAQSRFTAAGCSEDYDLPPELLPGIIEAWVNEGVITARAYDGNRFKPETDIPFECIIQGDGLYASIAAASILAKTYRDDFMQELHLQFPILAG